MTNLITQSIATDGTSDWFVPTGPNSVIAEGDDFKAYMDGNVGGPNRITYTDTMQFAADSTLILSLDITEWFFGGSVNSTTEHIPVLSVSVDYNTGTGSGSTAYTTQMRVTDFANWRYEVDLSSVADSAGIGAISISKITIDVRQGDPLSDGGYPLDYDTPNYLKFTNASLDSVPPPPLPTRDNVIDQYKASLGTGDWSFSPKPSTLFSVEGDDFRLYQNATGQPLWAKYEVRSVNPGDVLNYQFLITRGSTSMNMVPKLLLNGTTEVTVGDAATVPGVHTYQYTVPAGINSVVLFLDCPGLNLGNEVWFTDVFLGIGTPFTYPEPPVTPDVYVGKNTYHNIKNTRMEVNAGTEAAPSWIDILGPTHSITITKEELDLGTLTAEVLDANLDPSTGGLITPGKTMRLQRLSSNAVWENVFTGTIMNADVNYVPKTRINLTAVDIVQRLANIGENRGVANIDDLPHLLNGRGVSWLVNGSSTVPATGPTVVAYNENASVLDQVAITRDTNLGYAWIDRNGVVVANDAANMPTVPSAHFTDTPAPAGRVSDITNFITNPSFEVNTTGWLGFKCALSLSAFNPYVGSQCLRVTADGGTFGIATYGTDIPIEQGQQYTLSARIRHGGGQTLAKYVQILWITAGGGASSYGATNGSVINATPNSWELSTVTDVPPVDAAFARIRLIMDNTAVAGDIMNVDAVMFSTEDVDYFDGDTPGAVWNGTPHNSTSTLLGNHYYSYSDLDVNFNTQRVINQVNIKWLRYDIGAAKTDEIPYGPYVDQASIDQWGAYSAEFTIQGDPANETEAFISAYASQILAANSTPTVRANGVVVPVRNGDEFDFAGNVDLYDLVHVAYKDKVDANYRITGIEHNISPDKWQVTLSFDVEESVASPTFTPSPPFKGVSGGTGAVTSVNGQTGDVVLDFPVDSVNGKTGDVTLDIVDAPTVVNATGDFTGNMTFMRVGGVVFMSGYTDNDTLGAADSNFHDTGIRVPAGWEPAVQEYSMPVAPFNSTGIQFRYRVETTGVVNVQRNGTNGTFMVIMMMWRVSA